MESLILQTGADEGALPSSADTASARASSGSQPKPYLSRQHTLLTYSSLLSQWYSALGRGNCLLLGSLLRSHPPLILEGWKEDRMRDARGSPLEEGKTKEIGDARGSPREQGRAKEKGWWMGCTALHVAALRGSLELVKKIVNVFGHAHDGEWFLDEQHVSDTASPKEGGDDETPFSVEMIKDMLGQNHEGQWFLDNEHTSDSQSLKGETEKAPPSSLGELLAQRDGTYKLEALAVATIHGNRSIMAALMDASLKCECNPYRVEVQVREHDPPNGHEEARKRKLLSRITREFMKSLPMNEMKFIAQEYSLSTEFNFLPWDVYLCHFTFHTNRGGVYGRKMAQKIREEILNRIDSVPQSDPEYNLSKALRRFVLVELQDGQGRSALHVAVDAGGFLAVKGYLSLVPTGLSLEYADWVNPLDGPGRTPLYRAAATGRAVELIQLLRDPRTDLNAKFVIESYLLSLQNDGPTSVMTCDFANLSERNGFKGYEMNYLGLTALQIAIIHKKRECVEILLSYGEDSERPAAYGLDVSCAYVYGFHAFDATRAAPGSKLKHLRDVEYSLEPLQLAVMMRDSDIVQFLLEDPRAHDMGRPSRWPRRETPNSRWQIPALHLAAALGEFDIVKVMSDTKEIDRLYNPFVKDAQGNTALHRAVEGTSLPFIFHMLHCVGVDQAAKLPRIEDGGRFERDDMQGEARDRTQNVDDATDKTQTVSNKKQGCVELLLQAGLEAWTTNADDQAPYLASDASPEFHTWWFKRMAKETLAEQNTLNVAANAISVTAALVATASYVGPLQPPLNYEANSLQAQIVSVRVFIVCDTLSFYFALVAIMLAVIPALPIPQQPPRMELQHTRRIVTLAVAFLFPSIVCVFVAFAAGSIAVLPNRDDPWGFGGLSISTALVGGPACLFVMYIFCIRLLQLVLFKSAFVKRCYRNSIYLDQKVFGLWKLLVNYKNRPSE